MGKRGGRGRPSGKTYGPALKPQNPPIDIPSTPPVFSIGQFPDCWKTTRCKTQVIR